MKDRNHMSAQQYLYSLFCIHSTPWFRFTRPHKNQDKDIFQQPQISPPLYTTLPTSQ